MKFQCALSGLALIAAAIAIAPALAQSGAAPLAADVTGTAPARHEEAKVRPPRPESCYSAREMSDRVARLRLFNPLMAMKLQARRLRADPLRTRLCRFGSRLIYELSLIRRDGKVLRIYVSAHNGKPVSLHPQ